MDSIVEKVEMLSAAITSVQRRLNHNLPSFSGCTQHRVLKTPPAQKSLHSEMESINPSLQDEAAERFTLDIISSVSAKTILLYFDKVSTVDESPVIYTKLVRAIMYGLGVKMTKDTLLKGIGKAHCDFRFCLVLKVIRSFQDEGTSENSTINGFHQAVQENSYNDFSLPGDGSAVVDVNLTKILDAHVRTARDYTEKPREETRKIQIADEDRIPIFLASTAYICVMEFLRKGRDRSKCRFFEELAYLFSEWSVCDYIDEDYEKPGIRFLYPQAQPISCAELPDSCSSSLPNFQKVNKETLHRFLNGRRELVVEVSHNVMVAPSTTTKVRRDSNFREMEIVKEINLLEVSLNFLLAFSHARNLNDLLSIHSSSFRTIYRIALVFRALVEEELESMEKTQDAADQHVTSHRYGSGTSNLRCLNRALLTKPVSPLQKILTMADLIPGKTARVTCLDHVLRLTKASYEAIMKMRSTLSVCNGENGTDPRCKNGYSEASIEIIDLECIAEL